MKKSWVGVRHNPKFLSPVGHPI